jgi:hypothetical protein
MDENEKCGICGEVFTSPYAGDGIAEMCASDSTSVDDHVICHYQCGQGAGLELA